MDIHIKIDKVEMWHRNFDKQWVIDVNACTDNVALALRYSGKKPNDAKRRLVKNLPNDLLEQELIYRHKMKAFKEVIEK